MELEGILEARELAADLGVLAVLVRRHEELGALWVSCYYWVHVIMSCMDWVPQGKSTRHPASCPLAAGQARALAGWPRACFQSVSDLCMMHA